MYLFYKCSLQSCVKGLIDYDKGTKNSIGKYLVNCLLHVLFFPQNAVLVNLCFGEILTSK